jgi:3-hydroxybutyrate dehydrogenase
MSDAKLHVLITGAGSGLGRGLGLCLAKAGHSILATDLVAERAAETAKLIRDVGGRAESFGLDVTSEKDVETAFFGIGDPVDVLINNAGIQKLASVEAFPADKWRQLMDVMMTGPFLMTKAVLPGMRARGFGRLVHIGSFHSLVASPFKSAYVAAKHALVGFSKTVALETAGTDITSNVICPAYMRTPLVDAQIADQARTRGIPEEDVVQKIMLAPMPKKAFITFEEIAALTEYLTSPLARNVTGQTIAIDGGWTAQ